MSIDVSLDFIASIIMIQRYTYLELSYYIMSDLMCNLEIE